MPLTVPAGLRSFADDNVAGPASAGSSAFGNGNVLLGAGAGANIGTDPTVSADDNIIIGFDAAPDVQAGGCVVIGRNAFLGSVEVDNQICIGFESGPLDASQVQTGNEGNIYMGPGSAAELSNATNAGESLIVIGIDAYGNQDGGFCRNCVVIGARAAMGLAGLNQNSQNSVAIGVECAENVGQGINNSVAIGYRAGRGSGGSAACSGCIFLGSNVGINVTVGVNNVGIGGTGCLNSLTSGTGNIALGTNCLENLTTGSGNFCAGLNTGGSISGGDLNILIGDDLLGADANSNIMLSPDGVGPSTDFNIVLGYRVQAGAFAEGTFCVESPQSIGINRKTFLFGDMNNGNLILGESNDGAGVANNRDMGGGGNTFKILSAQLAAGIPTANPVGGFFIYHDNVANELRARGPAGTITTLALD